MVGLSPLEMADLLAALNIGGWEFRSWEGVSED
jgi:hypothetical protein